MNVYEFTLYEVPEFVHHRSAYACSAPVALRVPVYCYASVNNSKRRALCFRVFRPAGRPLLS